MDWQILRGYRAILSKAVVIFLRIFSNSSCIQLRSRVCIQLSRRAFFFIYFFTHTVCLCNLLNVKFCALSSTIYLLWHEFLHCPFCEWETVHLFNLLMIFLPQFLRSLLVLPRNYFLIFSFVSASLMIFVSSIHKLLEFSFSSKVVIFSWFGSSIPQTVSLFPLFLS